MTRELVTIRQISKILPHPNADRLELATIDGWQVVVAKGEFERGQDVVYFEIDSLIPVVPEFEFLRKYCYIKKDWLVGVMANGEAFRIKTIKLRGELSQGLIIPVSDKLRSSMSADTSTIEEVLDDFFGIRKYDPPQQVLGGTSGTGESKHLFPEFIPKTDQERIQNISQHKITELFTSNEKFEVTRKYNGSSITIFTKEISGTFLERVKDSVSSFFGVKVNKRFRVGVCSRNLELDLRNTDNKYINTAMSTGLAVGIRKLSENLGKELAVQGELCGPGVQGNYYDLDSLTIYVFDIYDISERKYLLPADRTGTFSELQNTYNVTAKHAYVEFSDFRLPSDDRSVLIALGEYSLHNRKENEGLVFKSCERDFSFKCISNKFLLKNEQ